MDRTVRRLARLVLAAVALGSLAGCGGDRTDTTATSEPSADGEFCESYPRDGMVIEGDVLKATGLGAFPTEGSVEVVWRVFLGRPGQWLSGQASFGEGCYEREARRYVVAFDEDPPDDAMNWLGDCQVGLGSIELIDEQLRAERPDYPADYIVGAVSRFTIVFRKPCDPGGIDPATFAWAAAFPEGYSLARCVDGAQGLGTQHLEPVDPATATVDLYIGRRGFCDVFGQPGSA